MPASRVAPWVTAWRAGHRGLPGTPAGGYPTAGGVPFLDQFVPGYSFGARIYPGADTTTDPTTWTPVDISAHILQPGDGSMPAISIGRARLGEQQQTSPALCVFTLRNDPAKGNGAYTPRRATSPYWPYMRAGLPVDVFIATALATYVRFAGKVEELAPGWDETGNYAVVMVTAYGVLYDIEQGSTPLRSASYRAISGAPHLLNYWSLEDGATATQAANDVAGGAVLATTGTVAFGAPAGNAASASAVDLSGGGTLSGTVRNGTAGTVWAVSFSVVVQDTGLSTDPLAFAPALFITGSNGFAALVSIACNSDFHPELSFAFFDYANFPAGEFGNASGGAMTGGVGTVHTFTVYMQQVTGSTFAPGIIVDGVDQGLFPVPFTGSSIGRLSTVTVGATAAQQTSVETGVFDTAAVSVCHVAHYAGYPAATIVDNYSARTGHVGETPSDRLARISAEEHIPFALPAGPSDPARTMGAQQVDTLGNIARDCETTEGGVLEDGVNFGWQLWTVESRYNQTAAFTPALTQLQPPLLPMENTLRIRNDVTAAQPAGTSARYSQPAGQPYAVSGPGGLGGRSYPVTMNVNSPDLLLHRAAWLVHLGTVDADRYAPLAVNLAARTGLIPAWLALGNGDRWTTTSTYPTGGTGPDVLVEGWTEGLGRVCYTIAANTAPADPWNVLVVDDPVYGRIGSDSTTLAAAVAAGVTGAVSVNVGTALWSTAAGDYPLDFNISGERVTVSAVSGAVSPQTFTVSARAVNGVSKDLAAGAKVDLWLPLVIGP
jgi:hypothetical protein